MKTLQNTGTYNYSLRYYEKDLNRYIKPVSIFNFMQDVAAMHAQENNFGEEFTTSNKMAWFALKYKLVILENLYDLKDIEIKTESRGIARLFAYRDFYFYNEGKMFAKAASQWALVDFNTKKILKPQDVLSLQPYEKREDDLEFSKILSFENPTFSKEFRIRFDDIDINQHVNNAIYPAWALEVLNFDFRKNHAIKTLDIYFKKDIATDGKILSEVYLDEEIKTTYHSIKNAQNGEELCTLMIEWEEI